MQSFVSKPSDTLVTRRWNEVVGKILSIQDPEEKEGCHFDPIGSRLMSLDGSRFVDVDANTVMDLICGG
eukprot:6973953-Lingulodinium_polyedra.AAC.1